MWDLYNISNFLHPQGLLRNIPTQTVSWDVTCFAFYCVQLTASDTSSNGVSRYAQYASYFFDRIIIRARVYFVHVHLPMQPPMLICLCSGAYASDYANDYACRLAGVAYAVPRHKHFVFVSNDHSYEGETGS